MATAKKNYRWEEGRAIVEHLLPTLPSAAYSAVILYCWFRAYGKSNTFVESASQIGKSCNLSARQVQRILADLENVGIVTTICPGVGMKPSVRKINRVKYPTASQNDQTQEASPP